MKAITFSCTPCEKQIKIRMMVLEPDTKIVLVGLCENCGDTVRFDIENAIAALYDTIIAKGSEGIN